MASIDPGIAVQIITSLITLVGILSVAFLNRGKTRAEAIKATAESDAVLAGLRKDEQVDSFRVVAVFGRSLHVIQEYDQLAAEMVAECAGGDAYRARLEECKSHFEALLSDVQSQFSGD